MKPTAKTLTKQVANILIVDDDEDILVAGKLLLKRQFSDVSICNRPEQLPQLLEQQDFDLVLLDMNFSPGESSGDQGFYWLQQVLKLKPDTIVIMITAHGGVDVAVEAMKLGATDFIAKPWHNEKVIATVSTALELRRSRQETQALKATNQELMHASHGIDSQIIGQSAAMQSVFSLVERAAPTDANVLILGENGTGKELIARALHQQSLRSDQVFLSVDLGSITESLFESELFGHKKGAFTGATQDRVGKLKAAHGGTLFLDEIGNLPMHLQAKLLTVLEQRQVTPVGANKAEAFDVRIIAATNVDKAGLADERRFRQDLLFRLNTVEILLPPLRERKEDIEPIAQHYIDQYARKYQKGKMMLSQQAQQALRAYDWPGNIRALRHAVERAIILAQSNVLDSQDFQIPTVASTAQPATTAPLDTGTDGVSDAQIKQTDSLHLESLNLEQMEKQAIAMALRKHGFNISHTAKELGLTRAALYRRMEKHGL